MTRNIAHTMSGLGADKLQRTASWVAGDGSYAESAPIDPYASAEAMLAWNREQDEREAMAAEGASIQSAPANLCTNNAWEMLSGSDGSPIVAVDEDDVESVKSDGSSIVVLSRDSYSAEHTENVSDTDSECSFEVLTEPGQQELGEASEDAVRMLQEAQAVKEVMSLEHKFSLVAQSEHTKHLGPRIYQEQKRKALSLGDNASVQKWDSIFQTHYPELSMLATEKGSDIVDQITDAMQEN